MQKEGQWLLPAKSDLEGMVLIRVGLLGPLLCLKAMQIACRLNHREGCSEIGSHPVFFHICTRRSEADSTQYFRDSRVLFSAHARC